MRDLKPRLLRGFFMARRTRRLALARVATLALLSGCASTPPEPPPAVTLSEPFSDPLRCVSRTDCTTKVSRTLLFVFDYAAAGAALVQRDGRRLFTPDDAAANQWPAIFIHLAEPEQGRFGFHSHCLGESCRLDAQQMLQLYRGYLQGQRCSWQSGRCAVAAGGR